ncbi:MAG TPA: NAD(P)H-dependent glycerol-3-phosphate dehydrogenase [Stellaceae bacterium]|nr:NAD(P)H-dependent glycerol-3-phosphate dehydrogenase [Stellaceae bacterium]
MKRLAIIGGGAWGTALACVATRAGARVALWARNPDVVAAVNERHENPLYLPGVALDPAIAATTEAAVALADAEAALLVVPAQFVRFVLLRLAPHLPDGLPLLCCAKGIEAGSLKTMSEVAAEIAPASPVAVLSGPSFAAEAAQGQPTAVTIASRDPALARAFVAALGGGRFRPYSSPDPIGAELGGAVKNVLAIACGIVAGKGLGDNARAALITRGLAEMVRLGRAKGARPETFRGLSGLGDLVLTCTALQSRNYALGAALGRGTSLAAALGQRRAVVEGIATASAVVRLAAALHIEMPIAAAVDGVLHRGTAIDMMIAELLSRPYRSE